MSEKFYLDGVQISKVLMIGYGSTGKSIHEFLKAFSDTQVDISKSADDFEDFKLDDYDLIAVSPGIPLNKDIYAPLRSHENIISDMDIFYDQIKDTLSKTIVVTGSNGKSTTVTMLNYVLNYLGYKSVLIGNIGTPVLSIIDDEFDYYVIELSSFQIDLLRKAKFDIGCVINVSPDHLDRYDSFEEYKQSKLNLENFCEEFIAYDVGTKGVKYEGCYAIRRGNIYKNTTKILSMEEVHLFGNHNLENIVVVLNILDKLNIDTFQAVFAIKTFKGLEHRCRVVETVDRVLYINDSKGTNVGATIAALYSITDTRNIVLLLGGVAKGGDFTLMEDILKKHVKYLHIYGQDRDYIENQIGDFCDHELNKNMKEAFASASKNADDNDVILLSPACASFDEFKNYEERGEAFEKLVKQLLLPKKKLWKGLKKSAI